MTEAGIEKKENGFFATVERLGNKMPHPAILFIYLTIIILILSWALSMAGLSAVHPSTGEDVSVVNLISVEGLNIFLVDFVNNFQAFPILGVVVVFAAITAICEKTGFLSNVIKLSIAKVDGALSLRWQGISARFLCRSLVRLCSIRSAAILWPAPSAHTLVPAQALPPV